MGKDVDEIVIGSNGSVYAAAIGSAIPASISEPLGVAWKDLGYVTTDGVTFTDSKDVTPIEAWQSFYALEQIVTGKSAMAKFSLMQWSSANVVFGFGGGSVEEVVAPDPPDPGEYRYHPPAPEDGVGKRMLAVEWVYAGHDFRLVLPRGYSSESVETNVTRTAPALLPITFAILGEDGQDPWILDTNHPAFAA